LVSSLVMYGTSLLPRQAGSPSHTAGCGTSGTYVARFTCQLSHSLFPSISLDLLHSEMCWSVFRVCLTSAVYLLHLSSLFWLRFYLVEILLLLLHKTAHMCPSLLPKDPNPWLCDRIETCWSPPWFPSASKLCLLGFDCDSVHLQNYYLWLRHYHNFIMKSILSDHLQA